MNIVGFSGSWRREQKKKFEELPPEENTFHKDIASASKKIQKDERKTWKKALKVYNAIELPKPETVAIAIEDLAASPAADAVVPYETVRPGDCALCCLPCGSEDARPQEWHPPTYSLIGLSTTQVYGESVALVLPTTEDDTINDCNTDIVLVSVEVHTQMLQRIARVWGTYILAFD